MFPRERFRQGRLPTQNERVGHHGCFNTRFGFRFYHPGDHHHRKRHYRIASGRLRQEGKQRHGGGRRGAHRERPGDDLYLLSLGRQRQHFQQPLYHRQFRHLLQRAGADRFSAGDASFPSVRGARRDHQRGVLFPAALRGPGDDDHGLFEPFYHHLHRPGAHVHLHLYPLRALERQPRVGRGLPQILPPRRLCHGLSALRHGADLCDDRHPRHP